MAMAMATSTYHVSEFYGNSMGGDRWNEGTYSGVRKITLTKDGDTISSLQVDYGLAGNDSTVSGISFEGSTHGIVTNSKTTYVLDFPDEYLTRMTGYFGSWFGHTVIKSLTFQTNKRVLGTSGPQDGTKFDTEVNNGKIVGFFGSSGDRLDSIGAYILKPEA